MSILVDKNTKVICQGFSDSALPADDLDAAAQKIVNAVRGAA